MDELVVIGKVKGGYGKDGALRVLPLTDFPERFADLERIFLTNDISQLGTAYEVEKISCQRKFIKIKLSQVNDLKTAWSLENFFVVLPKTERVPLEPDSYYITDLLGMEVVDEQGNFLGVLSGIIETGATPVLAIEKDGEEFLVPALRETIKEVNFQDRVMTVIPWKY